MASQEEIDRLLEAVSVLHASVDDLKQRVLALEAPPLLNATGEPVQATVVIQEVAEKKKKPRPQGAL